MFTIKIKTKSTKLFSWSSSGCRGLLERTTTGLHAAVIEAVEDFRDYARGDGAQSGLCACLVTWEDGDDLHAFILPNRSGVPSVLPWVLMRTQPERVTRMDRSLTGDTV